MDTQTLAHRFFYNRELRGEYARVNAHFVDAGEYWPEYPTYYSYSTPIGFIRKDKEGNECLVMSNHRYSVTTSKQMSELRAACPFHIYYVPDSNTVFTYKQDFKKKLEFYKEQGVKYLRTADVRNRFMELVHMYDEFNTHVEGLSLGHLRSCKTIRTMIEFCMETNKKLAERKKRMAERTEEEREAARAKREAADLRKLERVLGVDKSNVLSQLQLAFGISNRSSRYHYCSATTLEECKNVKDAATMLRNKFRLARDTHGRMFSYVWPVGNECHTSQGIKVDTDRVIIMLKAWRRKQNIIGEHISHYTIVENNEEVVKVGCHVIPLWNVEALYNKLVG